MLDRYVVTFFGWYNDKLSGPIKAFEKVPSSARELSVFIYHKYKTWKNIRTLMVFFYL